MVTAVTVPVALDRSARRVNHKCWCRVGDYEPPFAVADYCLAAYRSVMAPAV